MGEPHASHRPHGSGHPYRYDLDQRVPVHPCVGEPCEIRVLADPTVSSVAIDLATAEADVRIEAERADPEELIREVGPFPARPTTDGHLAAAAEAPALTGERRVWHATVSTQTPARYRVVAQRASGSLEGPWHELDPVRWVGVGGRLTVQGDSSRLASVEWLVGSRGPIRVRFLVRIDPDQRIIGLGERYATVDHRGETLDAVVFEQYKHQGRRTYLPVPLAVVVGGDHWAVYVDTTRRTWFDLAASDPDHIVIEADVDPANAVLDVAIWPGEPAAIVRRFFDETCWPRLPPTWVYEPWMSGNEWNTQARVEEEVAHSLALDIPVGVVVIEAWSDEATFLAFRDAAYDVHADGRPHRLSDFSFPADGAWPDPAGMVERLHGAGVKVLLWQIPVVPTDTTDNPQAVADVDAVERLGLAVLEADGQPYRNRGWWFPGALLPDFTSPRVRQWWAERRRYLLEDVGVDGFKTDGGEHLWGHDLRYADGTSGAESNNRFPVLYGKTYHELFDDVGAEAVTFSRAGFTGSAAYPCHWAGDDDSTWEGLRAAIRAGLSAGVAGIWFWGWDLGGFSGPIPDVELYLRAAAFAAFCPIMQYHSEFNHHRRPSNDRTPWNIAERTGDQRAVDVYRRFAHMRRRLVPYLATQAERSRETGKPLMRSLCFDHPDDPNPWQVPLQYQLGDDLLIAPVTEPGASEIAVYLPAGEWVDCFTGAELTGPTWVERTVPLDEIAAFRVPSSAALAVLTR